jgi:hypothetical protein
MDYTPIYDKYNGELRPLISEFEGREEQFEEPILKNMAYVVDELSLCVQTNNSDTQNSHLDKALQNLDEAVTNSYKYLVFSHHRRLKKFKRRFSKYQMQQFDNGKFVGKFDDDSKKAKKCIRRARKQDVLMEAKMGFKQAYDLYSVIEHEISDFESEGAAMVSRGRGIIGTIVKIVLSIAVSVAVAYCFSL